MFQCSKTHTRYKKQYNIYVLPVKFGQFLRVSILLRVPLLRTFQKKGDLRTYTSFIRSYFKTYFGNTSWLFLNISQIFEKYHSYCHEEMPGKIPREIFLQIFEDFQEKSQIITAGVPIFLRKNLKQPWRTIL